MQPQETPQQKTIRLGNYLRTHRRRAGLSLRELGHLLGYSDEGAVLRHEKSETIPPLLIGVAYEVVFRVPLKELFTGLHETVELTMEARILELEIELQRKPVQGDRGKSVAQKLAWIDERRAALEN